MNNIFLALEGGSIEQQKKRKIVVYAIIAATALLILSLLLFLISGLVSLFPKNGDKENNKDGVIKDFVTTTFSAEQSSNGTLLMLDDNHPYRGNASVILFNGAASRPKTLNNTNVYTIGGTTTLGATTETVEAFNKMIADFYAASAEKDDNLYINDACNLQSTSTNELYASGTCIALTYYFNWAEESSNRPSIGGVAKYQWIYDNAHKYGFISLTENALEIPSIFRYVGVAHATYIKNNSLSFESYIELLQTTSPQAPLQIATSEGTKYVYYIASGAEQLVPENNTYTVSGDNRGGFVVTVNE